MFVQTFLRNGGTLDDLETQYAVSPTFHQEHSNLVLLKYDQITSPFDQPIVQDCRGIILDQADNWRIINMSMRKFFNYGESYAATIDWSTARCLEKCDGSLIQVYPYRDQWHVATSGSPDAGGRVGDNDFTFNELFWRVFHSYPQVVLPPVNCGKCFFFELMTPYNQIVVQHRDSKLTLLGGRDLTTLQELPLTEAATYFQSIPVVRSFDLSSLDQCLQSLATFSGRDREGYVVVDGNFNRLKIKHPLYVRLHHLRASLNSQRNLIEVVRNGEMDEVMACLPEYTPILQEAKRRLDALVKELETAYQEIATVPVQRDFAQAALKTRFPPALFAVRAKKVPSIRHYFTTLRIDQLIDLLRYKGGDETNST